MNAQSILDFGAYFNQIELLVDFDNEWCPVLMQNRAIVDEIFIGLHMFKPDVASGEQFNVMLQLRRYCGFAVHACS